MTIKRTDLEKIVRQLKAVLTVLESELEPVEIPTEVLAEMKRKADAGICLAWDHQIPEGDIVRRGLCSTDYNTTMQRIARGQESERELMMKGQLGPPGKRGRPAAKDLAAEKAQKAKKVADDIERFNNRKRKTSPEKPKSDDKTTE